MLAPDISQTRPSQLPPPDGLGADGQPQWRQSTVEATARDLDTRILATVDESMQRARRACEVSIKQAITLIADADGSQMKAWAALTLQTTRTLGLTEAPSNRGELTRRACSYAVAAG